MVGTGLWAWEVIGTEDANAAGAPKDLYSLISEENWNTIQEARNAPDSDFVDMEDMQWT